MTIITPIVLPEMSQTRDVERYYPSLPEVHVDNESRIENVQQRVETLLSLLNTSPVSVDLDRLQTLLAQTEGEGATLDQHDAWYRALQSLRAKADHDHHPQSTLHRQRHTLALEEVKRGVATQQLENTFKMNQLEALVRQSSVILRKEDSALTVHTSYAALWTYMAEAIKGIKTDYIDVFAKLMLKYTEMYEAFNNTVQKAASDSIHSGDEGNYIKFSRQEMAQGYYNFDQARLALENALGKVKKWELLTENDKKNWVTTLSPAFNIDQNSGDIIFNIEQYSTMPKYPNAQESDSQKVSTASYQAWLATFNATSNGLQSNMQSFAQRYSQANSTFDNLNKVLSGAINSLADCAKQVFRNLS